MFIKTLKKLIPRVMIDYLWHLPIELFSAIRFGFPARKLTVIGVAGTKGKSTTVYLISQLLEKLGEKTVVFSTTTIKIGEKENLNDKKMTTVSHGFLQKLLKEAVQRGCSFAVLEVSSHGLKQFRTFGIQFDYVVLTNLAPDHLEYHKTGKDYQMTHKRMIGKKTKVLVLNADDEHLEPFRKIKRENLTFGFQESADIRVSNLSMEKNGSRVTVSRDELQYSFMLPLSGKFNVYNALASFTVLLAVGKDAGQISGFMSELKAAPGRLEQIENERGIEIYVDYAHSPESFENVFSAIKPYVQNRLIAVTGACGERDKTKRPIMGEILAKYCDFVVVTNDDPFGEDPEMIAAGLIKGLNRSKKMKQGETFWKILDRREGVRKGIELAKPKDTVMVLGKGAEQWQVFKDKKIPWDDRKVIREILSEM